MNVIKRFKRALFLVGIIAIILTLSFYLPKPKKTNKDEKTNEPVYENVLKESSTPAIEDPKTVKPAEKNKPDTTKSVIEDPIKTAEPAKKEIKETSAPIPTSVDPLKTNDKTDTSPEKNTLSCSITVRCDTILNNIELISDEKVQLVPENGIILPEIKLNFSEGDTVFDVLEKELKMRKIHFEFSKISMYDSVYIEGIGNLYEFDTGNLSGWIYRVNGTVPSVGCSHYQLKNGDKIEVLYTCNMGRDL